MNSEIKLKMFAFIVPLISDHVHNFRCQENENFQTEQYDELICFIPGYVLYRILWHLSAHDK